MRLIVSGYKVYSPINNIHHIQLSIDTIPHSRLSQMQRIRRIVQNFTNRPVTGPTTSPTEHALAPLQLLQSVRYDAFTNHELWVWSDADLEGRGICECRCTIGVPCSKTLLDIHTVSKTTREYKMSLEENEQVRSTLVISGQSGTTYDLFVR